MKLIAAALALFLTMTALTGNGVNGLQCCAKSCGSCDWYDNCGSSPRCTENKCPELNKPKKDCGNHCAEDEMLA